ncbi:MAG: TRAP transporter substrate-binding protein [Amphritea sp.]|nr:TRAP transporter substrate-binding protein [Amphritea sp.]
MKKKIGLTLAGALLTMGISSANADVKWDMSNEYSNTSIHGEGDSYFVKRLSEKTDGKFAITVHFGGALGFKSKDHLDAVGDGAVQIADTLAAPLGGIDPIFQLTALPFLAKTPEEAKILYEVAKPYYDEVFEKNNQKLLYASPWTPSGIWANKPVASIAELANLKIRTYDANGTVALRAAGAAPIQLSWGDVVPQLSTGGIAAVLTSADAGASGKFWEHLSYFTEVNYAVPLNMVHVNLDAYNALSPEMRQQLLDAAKDASEHNWNALVERRANNYKKLEANGVNIVTDAPAAYLEALSKAGQTAIDQWLEKAGPKGAKIIADYRQRLGM